MEEKFEIVGSEFMDPHSGSSSSSRSDDDINWRHKRVSKSDLSALPIPMEVEEGVFYGAEVKEVAEEVEEEIFDGAEVKEVAEEEVAKEVEEEGVCDFSWMQSDSLSQRAILEEEEVVGTEYMDPHSGSSSSSRSDDDINWRHKRISKSNLSALPIPMVAEEVEEGVFDGAEVMEVAEEEVPKEVEEGVFDDPVEASI